MRRDFWKKQLSTVLKNDSIATSIESCVYERYSMDSTEENYEHKLKQLVLNLNPTSYIKNTSLLPRVLSGEIPPERLILMSPIELFPEKWEETVQANKELLKKQVEGSKSRATTDMFFCGKCKKRETTYYEQQTRSSDEPMTKFIKCVNCGHEWKI
jgi:transcription elongation factor S-II